MHASDMTQATESPRPYGPLAYFPELYPGEILYSVFARLNFHMTHQAASDTWNFVYGHDVQRPLIGFPCRLDRLASRLRSGVSAEQLAMQHTLLPYYMAFAPQAIREKAMIAIRGDEGKVGTVVGVRAKPLGPLEAIRFCRLCFDEMIADYGEAYFRREHQLPIVLVCPTHNCDLRISTVKAGRTNRLYPATKTTCPENAPSVVADPSVPRDQLLKLARRATEWLNAPRTDNDIAAAHKIAGSIVQDGVRKGPFVDWGRLITLTDEVLAPLEPAFPGIIAGAHQKRGWLKQTLDPSRSMFSDPMCLLSLVLDEIKKKPSPFGIGPWPCKNPLADHCGQMTIMATESSFKSTRGILWVRFLCSCGHVYKRAQLPDGTIGRTLTVRYGPTLTKYVRNCHLNGVGISEAASTIGTNTNGLRYWMAVEGIWNPWAEPS